MDASWYRLLEGFWWIFGGKMEACWHQHREKIGANFEERFLKNLCFFPKGKTMVLKVQGIEVGGKNR